MGGFTFEGPVTVMAGPGVLLDAHAWLCGVRGNWGGFLEMRSVAGAELVQEARRIHRFLTIDGHAPAGFHTQRTGSNSPVLRISGHGRTPFGSTEKE